MDLYDLLQGRITSDDPLVSELVEKIISYDGVLDQLALVPGRMRRTLTSLWALCSGYGLYALLGITGLGLSCVFATHTLRSV